MEPEYVTQETLLDFLESGITGKFVVDTIPVEALQYSTNVYFKKNIIHTIRCGKTSVSIPSRYHLDKEGSEAIEMSRELGFILTQHRFFPFLQRSYPKISYIASHLAGIVASMCDPFWNRRNEKEADKAKIGGRSEVYQKSGTLDLVEYDIRSSFPVSAMGLLPVGAPYRVPVNSVCPSNSIDMVKIDVVLQNDIGVLPVRREFDIYYPTEGRIIGWYWEDEVEKALEYCETVRSYTIIKKLRFPAEPILAHTMKKLIHARMQYPEHEKTLKQIANQIIGMFAFQGRKHIVYYADSIDKIRDNDWPLYEEIGLFGRAVNTQRKSHTYRPFIASKVWSNARIELLNAIMTTLNPVSCHIDCVLAERQPMLPIATRIKKDYGMVYFECPYRGALDINGERVKAPGKRRRKAKT